ncbi:response regulator [Candidatus Riflebacteria bacterium]
MKVNIFEDNHEMIHKYKEILADERFHLFIHTHSNDGIHILRMNKPHLIIINVMMEGFGGIDFLQKIEQQQDLKKIPVLIVSDAKGDFLEETSLPENVFLLTAPYKDEDLRNKVLHMLDPHFDAYEEKLKNVSFEFRIHAKKQVMVFEDNEVICQLYKELLEEYGFIVNIKSHCICGVDDIVLNKPDLIIMDVNLQGRNALAFFKKIRREDACVNLPVLFISEVAPQLWEKDEGVLPYKTFYLKKPFQNEDFYNKIGLLLDLPHKLSQFQSA